MKNSLLDNNFYVVVAFSYEDVLTVDIKNSEYLNILQQKMIQNNNQLSWFEVGNIGRGENIDKCIELTNNFNKKILDFVKDNKNTDTIRILYSNLYLDTYREEYIKANNTFLYMGVDHSFRKRNEDSFKFVPYINFKKCDVNNFILDTYITLLKKVDIKDFQNLISKG